MRPEAVPQACQCPIFSLSLFFKKNKTSGKLESVQLVGAAILRHKNRTRDHQLTNQINLNKSTNQPTVYTSTRKPSTIPRYCDDLSRPIRIERFESTAIVLLQCLEQYQSYSIFATVFCYNDNKPLAFVFCSSDIAKQCYG